MPTTSGPMPPPNPYTGGCNNPGSNKETKASQILEIAISAIVILIVLAVLCAPQKNYQTIEDLSETNKQMNQENDSCGSDAKDIKSEKFKKISFYDALMMAPDIFINSKILMITTSIALPTLFYTSDSLFYKLILFCLLLAITAAYIRYMYISEIKKLYEYIRSKILQPFISFLKSLGCDLIYFLKIIPIPLLLTFISWTIACFPIEQNIFTAIISTINNPSLLLILLISAIITSFAMLPTIDSINEASKSLIKLEFSNPNSIDSQKGGIKSFVSGHLKVFTYILPISTVIAFIFVLYHNKEVAKEDLGLALQITSAQFPEQKFTWATVILVYMAIFYISVLPAIALPLINQPSMNQDLHGYILLKNHDNNEITATGYFTYLIIQVSVLATASSFTIFYILRLTTHGGFTETMLVVVALSTTACTIPISHIINRGLIKGEQSNKDANRNRTTARIAAFILAILILCIFYLSPKLLLDYMPKSIGGIVANPGTTIETNEIDYACVFPSGETSPKSIAFGIVTSSDNSSVHLFTPTYDTENKRYAERLGIVDKKLNKLIESRIKYTNGFYIEKYDGKIHIYDENSGQCIYKSSLPFYMNTYPWKKQYRN